MRLSALIHNEVACDYFRVRSAEYRLGDAISNKSSAYFAVAGSNAAS
jgi:hypothetical protein